MRELKRGVDLSGVSELVKAWSGQSGRTVLQFSKSRRYESSSRFSDAIELNAKINKFGVSLKASLLS